MRRMAIERFFDVLWDQGLQSELGLLWPPSPAGGVLPPAFPVVSSGFAQGEVWIQLAWPRITKHPPHDNDTDVRMCSIYVNKYPP